VIIAAEDDLDWGDGAKGYMEEDFWEIFGRYMPRWEVEALTRHPH